MRRIKKDRNSETTSKTPSFDDERFAHIPNNPIFKRVPVQEKRIDVDERFHSMFHDSKFKLKYKVDKRGRPVTAKTDKRLETYYTPVETERQKNSTQVPSRKSRDGENDVVSSEAESDEEDEEGQAGSSSDANSAEQEDEDAEENNDLNLESYKSTLTAEVKKKLRDANIDYARGDRMLDSEESSTDSSDTEEESDEDLMHEWGEIDKDASRTEEATSRLALCNMDWDNLRAVDLMILFNSFLPAEGVLISVAIYPSEFGKERMAEEDVSGPKELAEMTTNDSGEESENDNNEDEDVDEYHREKLRKYQLNRLKYYYAVLQFDSAESAEKVYSECDGMEYESSSTRIDLRFVPEDMTFDDVAKDKCDQLPDAEKYRPRFFTTTALQQIKVALTWDETDPMRKELTELVFDPKAKVDDEDLAAYLASSSSESEEELGVEENQKELEKSSQKDRLAKYRSLLVGIEESKQTEKDDVQMEITWGVGLKKKTEELVKKKKDEEMAKDRTPWEEMLAKQKEKKKQKRKEKKKISQENEESDQPFSDDDVDVDLNDDFFKEEIASTRKMKSNTGKRGKCEKNDDESTEAAADKAALELLMMDDEDNKSHFSLKKILADSAEKTKKKKKRKEKADKDSKNLTDNFEINVEDDRFSALYSSHLFNVDPSDPNYKKTKAMEKIVNEKLKRRPQVNATKNGDKEKFLVPDSYPRETTETDIPSKEKYELQSLVKSIKRKAELMKNTPKQKKLK